MRYINDDAKLRNGGRKAPIISEAELSDRLIALARKHADAIDMDEDDAGIAAMGLIDCGAVEKDLKIMNYPENFDADHKDKLLPKDIGKALTGMQTLDNGLVFYGIAGGADWAMPMFYVLYWDGKAIRAYIPTKGNLVNMDAKTALGIEDESRVDTYSCLDDEDPQEAYLKKYGLTSDTVFFNWNAIQEDIKARIVITPAGK